MPSKSKSIFFLRQKFSTPNFQTQNKFCFKSKKINDVVTHINDTFYQLVPQPNLDSLCRKLKPILQAMFVENTKNMCTTLNKKAYVRNQIPNIESAAAFSGIIPLFVKGVGGIMKSYFDPWPKPMKVVVSAID